MKGKTMHKPLDMIPVETRADGKLLVEVRSPDKRRLKAPVYMPKNGESKADLQAEIDALRAIIAKARGDSSQ